MKKYLLKALTLAVTSVLLLTGCVSESGGNTHTVEPFTPDSAEVARAEAIAEALRGNMPKTDGSTSTLPLDIAVHAAILGISRDEAAKMVAHTKTYTSLSNLIDGECDIIIRTPLSQREREILNSDSKYEEVPVASEGFVFVVNKNNPVDTLTEDQLRDIYSGKITNWSEVGGEDLPIIAYQRNSDSGSQNYMLEFMGGTPLMNPITEELPATMSGILNAIANYDNATGAIGYSVYAYSDGMYEDMAKIKYIKVNGVEPSLETIADGTYPIRGYNYAIYDSQLAEDAPARLFCEWMLSDVGQMAIAEAGYVPYRRIEGLSVTIPDEAKLYTAVGTSEYTASDSDYYYRMSYIRADDFPRLSDERVDKIVRDYIAGEQARLDAITDDEIKTFLHGRGEYGEPHFRKNIELNVANGYLSVLSSIVYIYGVQDAPECYYSAEGAVFDLYTGERLELSDLFPKDCDFVPALNAHLLSEAAKPYSGFGNTHNMIKDFSGLREGKFTFTADSIIFDPDDVFFDGIRLSIDELYPIMITSEPRDMEGLFADTDRCIYKTLRVNYGYASYAEEYENGNFSSPITVWFIDKEKASISPEVCDKVNGFIKDLCETKFTPEAFMKIIAENGTSPDDVEQYSVGPFADFGFTIFGKRYIEVSGANLLGWNNSEGESFETAVIDDHSENEFYFHYYFSAETGEALSVDELFSEGWRTESSVSLSDTEKPSAMTAESFFTNVADMNDITVTVIRNYESAPNRTGEVSDNDIPVTVGVYTGGEAYTISVPRRFIP